MTLRTVFVKFNAHTRKKKKTVVETINEIEIITFDTRAITKYGFALDFRTAAHEARMSGRIQAPSAGHPVDTPPTPDAHVTISNKNIRFSRYIPTLMYFRCAIVGRYNTLYTHVYNIKYTYNITL